eukprot:12894761-Prorocentrum_lima.AAC.1
MRTKSLAARTNKMTERHLNQQDTRLKNRREQTSKRYSKRHTQRQVDKVNRENPRNKTLSEPERNNNGPDNK